MTIEVLYSQLGIEKGSICERIALEVCNDLCNKVISIDTARIILLNDSTGQQAIFLHGRSDFPFIHPYTAQLLIELLELG